MEQNSKVVFHENKDFDPIPRLRPEPKTLTHRVLNLGIVHSAGDAAVIIAILAIIFIAVNIYLFAKAVPPPHTLGEDRLRSGETVPAYTQPR